MRLIEITKVKIRWAAQRVQMAADVAAAQKVCTSDAAFPYLCHPKLLIQYTNGQAN